MQEAELKQRQEPWKKAVYQKELKKVNIKKINNTIFKKIGCGNEQKILQRRNTNGQYILFKGPNILGHQKNADLNYLHISSHHSQIAIIIDTDGKCWDGCCKGDSYTL